MVAETEGDLVDGWRGGMENRGIGVDVGGAELVVDGEWQG